jgi:hypothetical protein
MCAGLYVRGLETKPSCHSQLRMTAAGERACAAATAVTTGSTSAVALMPVDVGNTCQSGTDSGLYEFTTMPWRWQ